MPKYIPNSALKSRISRFLYTHENDRNVDLPTIDKEWLKDAELVRLESQKIGYFNKRLKYDKILLGRKKNYVEKDGMRIYYYNTGEVKSELPDVNVKQETASKTYYKTGGLEAIWVYKNGELNGISKTYYQDGTLKAEWSYINGKINGISKSYYQSGELLYAYTYVDGKLEGVAKKYDENGKLIAEKVFESGNLIEK